MEINYKFIVIIEEVTYNLKIYTSVITDFVKKILLLIKAAQVIMMALYVKNVHMDMLKIKIKNV